MSVDMKVGLISDTHSYLDPKVFEYFKDCDEIWHAGDVGELGLLEQLEKFKPTCCVYGNIDNAQLRSASPEDLLIERNGLVILMSHIGGKPPNYNPRIRKLLDEHQPDVFVCGHSHILRVISDKNRAGRNLSNLVYLNPGAAGKHGFHSVRTILRFDIEPGKLTNMEVIELGKRGKG